MHDFEFILILLVAVLASSFVGARFPRLPTPLVQIATGIVLTLLPLSFEMHLNPELFMVVFIAPLLFADARRMNKQALWRLKYPVLLLALGLVFCTVLLLGFAVNLFAPSIPLAAAFALAAALAPTDAVSVASLRKNAKISSEQNKLLQGEALLNDASSIVSFNFAIAAVITGTFSVWEAEGVFLIKFLGGMVLGVVVMLVRYGLIRFLRSRGMESVSFHVLFEIITPFLVYLLAEAVGVSGIIAVVAAGIAHSFEPRAIAPSSARLNVVSTSAWSVIDFTLNGLVFLILGTQLPYVVERVWTGTAANTNYLLLFVVFILAFILVLRFFWLFFMRRNVNLRETNAESAFKTGSGEGFDEEDDEDKALLSPNFGEMTIAEHEAALEKHLAFERLELKKARSERRLARKEARKTSKKQARLDKQYWKLHLVDSLVLSLSGVKGAITLAIILSVPMTIGGAEPFPERDLLIFLASGVILLSLLLANILVPLIAPKRKQARQKTSELNATLDIYRKVISELTETAEANERSAVSGVVRQYYQRIETLKINNSLRLPNETQVRKYVIELQLENTQRLTDLEKVGGLTAYYNISVLSRQLARADYQHTLRWEVRAMMNQLTHQWKARRTLQKAEKAGGPQGRMVLMFDLHTLQLANYRYVVEKLGELEPSDEFPAYTVALIKNEMNQRIARLESRWERSGTMAANIRRDQYLTIAIEARALDFERKAILKAYEDGKISEETAKMLRDNVALMELDIEEQLD
ncbi:MAG: sodium:proton antiporter [Coriobacteriia bacterium]|nr:sodium:proton antiporter [Coriobacteriia bacterium]MCL2749948.1 sodium:proton antiporter [Coriobacteriia bacterium]